MKQPPFNRLPKNDQERIDYLLAMGFEYRITDEENEVFNNSKIGVSFYREYGDWLCLPHNQRYRAYLDCPVFEFKEIIKAKGYTQKTWFEKYGNK